MGAEDGYVAWLGGGVVDGGVLLDADVEDVFLGVGCRAGEFSDVLGGDGVFGYVEGEGVGVGCCHGGQVDVCMECIGRYNVWLTWVVVDLL